MTELERVLRNSGTDAVSARLVCWTVRWWPGLSRERAIEQADAARGTDSGIGEWPDPEVAAAAGALWDRRLLRRLWR